ncbi:Transferase [Macleaya cordata]|uniref:Transferase n=1 Tax=Macleaya cordata TaxID=56857 RepID=A0A200R0X6_MACCD|nr:Transferase [Macleaya cordata]
MKLKLKVEVVSGETIKPSRPTPHYLRTFNLSFLDQTAPAVYAPLILCYVDPIMHHTNTIVKQSSSSSRCDLLKKSLSETLTRYYTLAGRMKDDSFSVNCNDAGIEYVEARVTTNNNVRLSDVIENPDIHHLVDQFLPCEPAGFKISFKPLLAVQVNLFDCGGMVIGLLIYHTLADASSLITFIKDWTAIARGGATDHDEQIEQGTSRPHLDLLPTLFPQRDLIGFAQATGMKREEIVTKRLVFEASKIAELRKRSTTTTNINGGSDYVQEYPTRVEAVSAFIWGCFIDAFEKKKHQGPGGGGGGSGDSATVRAYGMSQAVNMRRRMVPPLPANCFGNMAPASMAMISINNVEPGRKDLYPNLVGKIREAIMKIDDHQVRKLQGRDAFVAYMKEYEEIYSSCTAILHFTSLCGFPSYEADFGWGKPEWVSAATYAYNNAVAIMNTRSRDGIEAWVNMAKEDMAEFERDEQLLTFVSRL